VLLVGDNNISSACHGFIARFDRQTRQAAPKLATGLARNTGSTALGLFRFIKD
jgi:hypothetical protein